MTASEELSLRYYEVCCLLLQRWKYSTQNNREDMNEASADSGASYDELRSILKHLRAKYMSGFNNAQKQGWYVGDFYGYYTSTKRPRGRPPTAGGEGGVARAAASIPRVQQQQQQQQQQQATVVARFVTGAGDLMGEGGEGENGSASSSPAGAVERRGSGRQPSAPRLPSSRARKVVAPYEPPIASTHVRSSSISSSSSSSSCSSASSLSTAAAAGRGRKSTGSKAQPPAKRSRGGIAAAAAAFSTAGQQQHMQVWEGQGAGSFRYESRYQEARYGEGGREDEEDTDEDDEEDYDEEEEEEAADEDAVVMMMMDGQQRRGSSSSSNSSKQAGRFGAVDSLLHLVAAAEKASGKKRSHKKGAGAAAAAAAAVARAVSPVEDDLGLLLLGLKARPAPFLRRQSTLPLLPAAGPAAAVVEPMEPQISIGSSSNSTSSSSVNELSPTTCSLHSSLGATTLDGSASMCSLSTHTSSSGSNSNSNSNGSFYTGHLNQPMPPRLSYPPMAYHTHPPPPPPSHHPHYYHPQHYYPHLHLHQQQQQQQQQHPYQQHQHHQHQQQIYHHHHHQQYQQQQQQQQEYYPQQAYQHNSGSQADLLHASYSSTMSLLSVPAIPGPAGGAAAEVLLPAAGAVGQQQQQKPAGSDRAAADLFVSMMTGIGGPTPSLSRTSSLSSSSSGVAGRTINAATATA